MQFGPEIEIFIATLSIILFAVVAHSTKIISKAGIILGSLIGIMSLFLGGFTHFIALLAFYIIGEFATRIGKKSKQLHEQRNQNNIIGNCSIAILALIAGTLTPVFFLGSKQIFTIAFFGAISAALADTLSSEIGMLSKKEPVLITTLKKVKKGTDGGITALGTFASIAGALVVGTIYFFGINNSIYGLAAILIAGIFGSGVDSFFGATFERNGKLDNTQVNLITTFAGAVVAIVILTIIGL